MSTAVVYMGYFGVIEISRGVLGVAIEGDGFVHEAIGDLEGHEHISATRTTEPVDRLFGILCEEAETNGIGVIARAAVVGVIKEHIASHEAVKLNLGHKTV